jgi:hypothetical protein
MRCWRSRRQARRKALNLPEVFTPQVSCDAKRVGDWAQNGHRANRLKRRFRPEGDITVYR